MSEDRVRLTVMVSGQVQGVGYRFFAVDEAAARSLGGYARNLPGGDVEVVAEGQRSALDSLLVALGRGPQAASVAGVEPVWSEAREEFSEFRIRL